MSDRAPSKGCPVPHDFQRLHPNAVDRTRRVAVIRKQLVETRGDMTFDLNAPQAEIRDARRAVVSLLTNYVWEFARPRLTFTEKIPKDHLFWYRFSLAVEKRLSDFSTMFYEGLDRHFKNDFPSGSEVELNHLLECLSYHNSVLADAGGEEYTTPRLNDLNLFGTRTIRALHEAYERKYGTPMKRKEFAGFMAQPDFEQSLVAQQYNDNDSHGISFQFIRSPLPIPQEALNLYADDLAGLSAEEREPFVARQRPLNPNAFLLDRDTRTFAFRNELVAAFRKGLPDLIPVGPDVRNCPVAYTYAFREMMRWLVEFVDYQLYDGPLPSTERNIRLDPALLALMHDEIALLVEPYVE